MISVFLSLFACGLRIAQVQCVVLSDLPTPSFVVDLRALRKSYRLSAESLPSLHIPKHGINLFPRTAGDENVMFEAPSVDVTFEFSEGDSAIGYLHASVVKSREDAIAGQDDPIETFLAELDFPPSLTGIARETGNDNDARSYVYPGARLVLGLNNHHVGSYYWARSAGAGASMDAPGVCFGNERDSGVLRWEKDGGPIECNSNDGKRSEWVNFLRKGDTVQLLPLAGQDCLLQFFRRFDEATGRSSSSENSQALRIFGVSSEGKPLGSDPELVCEWVKCID
mmetsp:Transcript_39472/g.118494  ORF Transcript_39472/g.118494 Transcript_39472/m.118494 type:complete len:282 (-) Transcript_39472:146-991(-)